MEIGELVTVQDVVKKIYTVRHNLRRLNRRRSNQTRMVDYIWYARELGLGWVNTMTGQIRDTKIVRIETDSGEEVNVVTDNEDEVGFVGFDAGKELVTQGDRVAGEEETTDVQDIIEVKEQLAGVPYIEDRVDVQSPSILMDEMHTRGPSTSEQARLIERLQAENKELKRRLAKYEGQKDEPAVDHEFFVKDEQMW